MEETQIRVFVAIDVPADVRQALGTLGRDLRDRLPKRSVRWVRLENTHLTLRFIGGVPSRDISALTAALQAATAGSSPFTLQLAGTGCFPTDRRPRVIWVGLGGELEPLSSVQSSVEERTAAWGTREQREFHPHLTLGRVVTRRRDDLLQIVAQLRGMRIPHSSPWRVQSIKLIRSVLASGGSQYTDLATFSLVGTTQQEPRSNAQSSNARR